MLQRGPRALSLTIAVLLAGCRPSSSPFTCTDAIACAEIAPGASIKIEPPPIPRSGGRK